MYEVGQSFFIYSMYFVVDFLNTEIDVNNLIWKAT